LHEINAFCPDYFKIDYYIQRSKIIAGDSERGVSFNRVLEKGGKHE